MSQQYSNPKRASDPYALPDVEVWRDRITVIKCRCGDYEVHEESITVLSADEDVHCPSCDKLVSRQDVEFTGRQGWFWWSCLPGCLPDSSPFGPFESEQEALTDAQANAVDDDSDEGDSDEPSEPGDEDVTANDPAGPFYYLGKKVADTPEELKAWMEREQYSPNVWWISDHGNPHLITDL